MAVVRSTAGAGLAISEFPPSGYSYVLSATQGSTQNGSGGGSGEGGDDTLIGSHVMILSGNRQHHFDRLDIPIRHQGVSHRAVAIGRDVWIGNGAIVLDDVGDHAIVAAGSVVTTNVVRNGLWLGCPGRLISSSYDNSKFL